MNLITKVLEKFFGNKSEKDIKLIAPIVGQINVICTYLQRLTNNELRNKTKELKKAIQIRIADINAEIEALKFKIDDEQIDYQEKEEMFLNIPKLIAQRNDIIKLALDEALPTAFAIVKETARRFKENSVLEVTAEHLDREIATKRESVKIVGEKAIWSNTWIAGGNQITWNMVHYDVQLIGGIALHQGKISEMATGEGKTLVATLPVFLNALAGLGVHLVTVNDYLAKRDSEWMGPIYEFHGLRTDCIDKHQPNSEERRNAYAADITYGTNNEFGFDYLRDNMAITVADLVQRGHNYAIVDEVDSVLIDDARTPLIISGPVPKGDKQLFDELKSKVVKLYDEQKKFVTQILAEAKSLIKRDEMDKGGILLLRAFKGLPKNGALIKFMSEQGVKTLLQKTENIYLAENSKRMPEITEELFFVIEEKLNSVEMTDKGIDLITGNSDDPNFFIMPDIGLEIAEIEKKNISDIEKSELKDKLLTEHSIKSERIHTINQLLKAYTMFEKDTDYVVMDNKVKIVDEQTGRILEGRRYSDGLHQAIEAKENVKIEAATQTFATITLQNYFRMYTKLAGMTGTAETEAGEFWNIYKLDVMVAPTNQKVVRKDHEDLVYRTKREKYNAVIKEIVKLAEQGRPVLVGTTSVEISELLSKMLSLQRIKHNVLNAKYHQKEADIVAAAGQRSTVTIATNMAGRGTDIKLSEEVRKAGGLAIIGTERHDSRRVDRQLRGRSGRQGDPGSSQFFVSLEDDLMRMFGSEKIAKVMDMMKLDEGEVIQHSLITKSIERAQKKVEENNFGVRKRLLEYDDVMNSQRKVIYSKRTNALYGEKLDIEFFDMLFEVVDAIVTENHTNGDYDTCKLETYRILSMEIPLTRERFLKLETKEIIDILFEKALDNLKRKISTIKDRVNPFIKDVYENQAQKYEYILVPITDGIKVYNIRINLKKAYDTKAREVIREFQRAIMLITIDDIWKEHLRELDDLKQAVQSASYEQKDPLLIYKMESFKLFSLMLEKYNKTVISTLFKAQLYSQETTQVKQALPPKKSDFSKMKTQKEDFIERRAKEKETLKENEVQQPVEKKKIEPVRVEKKIGRNDPCPCGSGKKYKSCHGLETLIEEK